MRPQIQLGEGYDQRSIEKVERLLELLQALQRNPFLEKRLVLHGGTALNLFHLPRIVRLSVDIDLLYVGSVLQVEMEAEREEVVSQLFAEARLIGYRIGTPKQDHAGMMVRMVYGSHQDHVKVDLNFLDRSPIRRWATVWAQPVAGEVEFRCLMPTELVARKICALFGYPMLTAAERPTVESLIARAMPLIQSLSRLAPAHVEYLRLLGEENVYRPELLFGQEPEALGAAIASPRMEWKLKQLRRRPSE